MRGRGCIKIRNHLLVLSSSLLGSRNDAACLNKRELSTGIPSKVVKGGREAATVYDSSCIHMGRLSCPCGECMGALPCFGFSSASFALAALQSVPCRGGIRALSPRLIVQVALKVFLWINIVSWHLKIVCGLQNRVGVLVEGDKTHFSGLLPPLYHARGPASLHPRIGRILQLLGAVVGLLGVFLPCQGKGHLNRRLESLSIIKRR